MEEMHNKGEQTEEDEDMSLITSSNDSKKKTVINQSNSASQSKIKHRKPQIKNAIKSLFKGKRNKKQSLENYSDFTKQIIIILFMCVMLIYIFNLYQYLLLPFFILFFIIILTQLQCFQALKVFITTKQEKSDSNTQITYNV